MYKVTRTATSGEKATYGSDTITFTVNSLAMAIAHTEGDPNGSFEKVEEDEEDEYLYITEE